MWRHTWRVIHAVHSQHSLNLTLFQLTPPANLQLTAKVDRSVKAPRGDGRSVGVFSGGRHVRPSPGPVFVEQHGAAGRRLLTRFHRYHPASAAVQGFGGIPPSPPPLTPPLTPPSPPPPPCHQEQKSLSDQTDPVQLYTLVLQPNTT